MQSVTMTVFGRVVKVCFPSKGLYSVRVSEQILFNTCSHQWHQNFTHFQFTFQSPSFHVISTFPGQTNIIVSESSDQIALDYPDTNFIFQKRNKHTEHQMINFLLFLVAVHATDPVSWTKFKDMFNKNYENDAGKVQNERERMRALFVLVFENITCAEPSISPT